MATRRRLDAEMLRRGLAPSREAAKREIEAGRVTVGGAPVSKPARLVSPGDSIQILGPPPRFVSRAGEKLAGAVEQFGLKLGGVSALDAGSSTGGFTDCLLQNGAASVFAVDVGTHQLHEKMRANPRVTVMEQTDIRRVTPEIMGSRVDVVVGDLSFISLQLVLKSLFSLVKADGELVLLVKPQFEAGRAEVSKGRGVVSDPDIWQRVLEEVWNAAAALGAVMLGAMVSPITGRTGNVEFILHLGPAGTHKTGVDAGHEIASIVSQAREAHGLEVQTTEGTP